MTNETKTEREQQLLEAFRGAIEVNGVLRLKECSMFIRNAERNNDQ